MPLAEQLGCTARFFDLPNLRMHVVFAGPETGQPIILLHGFPEFWYSWRRQIPALVQAGYRVIVPDQRGYNLTAKNGPYDLRTLTQDIVQLIKACGYQSVYVAGHDWGAAVAWALSIWYPTYVRRLAILNVPHIAVMRRALMGRNWQQISKSWYIFYFRLPLVPEWSLLSNNCRNLRRMMRGSARKGTFTPADLEHYAVAWQQPRAMRAMLGWYRAAVADVFGRNMPKGKVTVPTRVLWGERDIALGVELAEESMQWVTNGQLFRFPKATHWLQADEPDAVNRHLLEHFGSTASVEKSAKSVQSVD